LLDKEREKFKREAKRERREERREKRNSSYLVPHWGLARMSTLANNK
jgi:hypothetical protein